MNALILAAGYATRLHPLTLNKAKPLLEVGGKPIVEWLFDNLLTVPDLETVYVVTNSKFADDFQNWVDRYQDRHRAFQIKIVNDGSTSDDDKLGAIGDINLVLTREELAKDDLVVIAGDNLFEQPLNEFVKSAKNSFATVAVHNVGDLEAMKKYGTVTIDDKGVITSFEEKPDKPKSTLAAVALYYYSREALPLFTTYLAAGNNPDQPGRFLQWLYTRKPVNTFEIKGRWLDIGSKETLENADKIFAAL
ncbi:MAG TPA: nucleotidyltransferase family protein [Chthoniobacterales bacterium]|jgi:glucose-1-phosphate thymidylyltransferase|nr:nucleotidyltransferase family protein [Chthoniobacterales bacterium]